MPSPADSSSRRKRSSDARNACSTRLRSVMSNIVERLITKRPAASLIAVAFSNTHRRVPSVRAISNSRSRAQPRSLKPG